MASRVFLLTDIESSTRMWAEDPAAMRAALEIHDRLVRDAVAIHGGRVFKQTGDGMFASFESALAAIRTAAQVQRSLRAHPWAQAAPMRVRVGVHAGEADRRGRDWAGPATNRCARLVGLASGGQTLVSDAARLLVKDVPLGDLRFVDMGEQMLRGLDAPEWVWQVVADDLPALPLAGDAASPSGGRRRGNLPLSVTRLVGRSAELADIAALLQRDARLLTLTGVGGVGKTCLALEAANSLSGRYPDGAWLFELAPLTNETAILATLAAAFNVGMTGAEGRDAVEDRIWDHLASRDVLLLLDNCEHVIDTIAPLVQTLLRRCPKVAVLATSRELLRVPGETALAVAPLAVPSTDPMVDVAAFDAVMLFCERARESRADFVMTDRDGPAVARICRRLDGIPLALELAAARARMLNVDQIADRLDDCFQLLGAGARTAVPRQHTLRAALDWSYDLLSPTEQTVLRRLAVFPERFTLEAAIAVLSDGSLDPDADAEPHVIELVSRLVDKSLIVVDSTGRHVRYRLLEPIRQYAAEKLSSAGETDATRRRHRDVFLADTAEWCAQLTSRREAPRILGDYSNYRAALEWSWEERDIDAALRLVVFYNTARLLNTDVEAREWLERVLSEPEPFEVAGRVQALATLAALVQESAQPDPTRAASLMHEASAMAERLADSHLVAWTQFCSAELHLAWGNNDEARALIDGARVTYELGGGSALPLGWCHQLLGWVAVAAGDLEQALIEFERAAELARGRDDGDWLAAHALAALAPLTALLRDAEHGLRLAEEAIIAARGLAIRNGLIMALSRAAETALLAGSHQRAATLLIELLGLLQDQASRRWVADALEMAGLVLDTQRDADSATAALRAADALRAASGEHPGGARVLALEVQRSRDRLLGDEHGPVLAADAAIARALEALSSAGLVNSPAPTPL